MLITASKMTSLERRAVFSIATVMSLRMIGLMMVLPIFTLFAAHLAGASSALIGLAIGIYGLLQAVFQIPGGMLSDHIGRKPILLIGLGIFIVGSVIAGLAPTINWLIVGRALQGMGAIGSTALALMADLTREDQRTKSMAITGISIGMAFTLAMVVGPVLSAWVPPQDLFFIAAGMGVLALLLVQWVVPAAPAPTWHSDTEPKLRVFLTLFIEPTLRKLNLGIFLLHALFTATFIALPLTLTHAGMPINQQWEIYVPTLIIAICLTFICMGIAESKHYIKPFFMLGIIFLLVAELIFLVLPRMTSLSTGLCLFFTGFTLLESFLPSLVSRAAPLTRKGSALGIYSCAQFLGIFTGGIAGGWLFQHARFSGVYLFCSGLALLWLIVTFYSPAPTKTPIST